MLGHNYSTKIETWFRQPSFGLAAADALERELLGSELPLIPSMTGIGAIAVLTIAIVSKRRRDSQA